MPLEQVPQIRHTPSTYYTPNPTLVFTLGGHRGINLARAEANDFSALDNAETVPFVTASSNRIAMRIHWPGYESWTYRNISICDHTYNSNPYSLARLAHTIARHVHLFLDDMRAHNVPNSPWHLANIQFDRLYLAELVHVAAGSWQPTLFYDRP